MARASGADSRMPRIVSFALAALLVAPVATSAAQVNTAYGPAEGDRVRVTAPAFLDVPIVGRLSAFAGDSLVMRASEGHATMRLPVAEVKQVELSEGHDRLGYALKLGMAGTVAGAFIGAASLGDNSLERMAGFFAGAVLGGPIGAAVGAIVAPEEWRIGWRPEAAIPATAFRLSIDEGTAVRFALRSDTTSSRRETSSGVVNDTLRLQSRNGTSESAVALRDLARLEISGGDDKRRGMLLGAGIVGGATAIFAGADASKGNISAGDAVGTVAVNAVLGALIGYALAPRGWERLPLPAR